MKTVHMLAYVFLWIGGLNWGLVGLIDKNLLEMAFGAWPMLVNVVYILVGLSAVYSLATHMGDCRVCAPKKGKK